MRARKERREMERFERKLNKEFNGYLMYLEANGMQLPRSIEEWEELRFFYAKEKTKHMKELIDGQAS